MPHGLLTAALATVLALWTPCVHAQAAALPEPVARALAEAGIPESATAFYVHEIGAERPLIAAGAERSMNPASTIKLVTTYAALELLGPAFQWVTEAYAAGALSDGVLAGDLVLKGRGDPKLTLENFWLLLRNLRARGLREIRGDLVLDRTYFAANDHDPARFDEQPTRPYNTGPDALLVNFKAVRLTFVPDSEARSVRILAEPALPQVQIVNRPALAQVVRDMNKFSNNVMARQLFLTLGAEGGGEPATPEKADRVIREWLAGKGLSVPELIRENGSGLSRSERISARNLGLLLLSSFRSPVMPELIASLPLAAVDGTMKKRLADADVAGQAHIKTGSP